MYSYPSVKKNKNKCSKKWIGKGPGQALKEKSKGH